MNIKNEVLLIQPNYRIKQDAKNWECNPPLGLCYLAGVLKRENFPVEIVDANVNNLSVGQIVRLIKRKKPKYVGFSIMSPAADWCRLVAAKLPKGIIKIAGGPHASGVPVETLRSGFDIVVVGEGEMTILEIIKGQKYSEIKGIYYMKGKKVIQNQPRAPLDPECLPLPARELIRNGGTNKPYLSSGTRYFPWAQIVTSRGCPFNCNFCNKNIFGYKFRPRSVKSIIDEIDFLVSKYKIKELDFYDDCFNFDMKRAEEVMDLLIKRKYNLYLRFGNGIRADKVNAKLLRKMKMAGTDYIAYGVESGDKRVLKLIPKGEKLSQIKKAVRLTNKIGIPVTGFFILGLIGDTVKSMENTIKFAVSLPFDRVMLNIATPFPGTRMWKMISESGGKILFTNWKDFYNTSGKMLYSMPGMASPKEVETAYRDAHIRFYFRPVYMLKHIKDFLSPSLFPILLRGIRRILFSIKKA